MKVVQVYRYGPPEVLEYTTAPDPQPGPGQILIKVESASVNYTDVLRRSNASYPFPNPLPFIPGTEVAGVIEALGEGVKEPPVGTPVFALIGADGQGYAQYALANAAQVIPIPPGLSPDEASAIGVAGLTAMLVLKEEVRLQPGETVLIQAAGGGVGSYAVQIAKLLGAAKIIGAASSAAKRELARHLGADHVVDYTEADWPEQVRELTAGRGVDVVLEMSGGEVFGQSLSCLAPFGRVVVYGMAKREPLQFDRETVLKFFYAPGLNQSLHVFGLAWWFGQRPEITTKTFQDLVGLVASGQIKVQIGQTLPLSRAAQAHRLLEERSTPGKLILKPWQEA